MSLATVMSRAQSAMDSPAITVETHLANGLPGFTIVGLPEAAVRESRDRVRGAIQNSGFSFPNKKITVNLAPADLPKEGSRFDLAIAMGILVASEQLPQQALHNTEYIGELALGGGLRKIKGVLPSALVCHQAGHTLILPKANENEASLIANLSAYTAESLLDILAHFQGQSLPPVQHSTNISQCDYDIDFIDVKGHESIKRAMLITAAGGHNLLMIGPPGTGKSMLAARLPSILPTMTETEALETASLYSISHHGFSIDNWRHRPYRHPHHTSSSPALVGGGSIPKPGEISLAHNGVLFLDELPEFPRQVLEVLREPLETKKISISRASRQSEYPANFQLIAAMNPCPCGFLGDKVQPCKDSPDQVARYRNKISGPLIDRIDIICEVNRISHDQLAEIPRAKYGSESMKAQVEAARTIQLQRQGIANANLSTAQIDSYCLLSEDCRAMLNQAAQSLSLSMRSYHRIQKLARSIADLDNQLQINKSHLAEAIQLRRAF